MSRECTIDNIVKTLLQDGVNSKRIVVEWLSNLTKQDIEELIRDLKVRLILENYAQERE